MIIANRTTFASMALRTLALGLLWSFWSVTASAASPAAARNPFVEAFFNSDDAFIKETILPNIERHRKADARLRFLSSKGEPLKARQVSVELHRHRFHFGCAPKAELGKEGPYRQAWRSVWEYAVPENSQKWYRIEPKEGEFDYSVSDSIVDFLKTNNYAVEYHFLAGYHPKWLADKTDAEKAASQEAHMLRTVERYHKSIDYFQVYNELWRLPVSKARPFVDATPFFKQLVRKYPDVKFGVSDCWRLNERLPDPKEVSRRFPGIDYIAIHAHAPRRLRVAPKVIYQCFEPYLKSRIKLHVTEFGIREGLVRPVDTLSQEWSKAFELKGDTDGQAWTEDLKAQYFVQTLMTCFSHPAVRAFCFWGMGPKKMFMDGNQMIKDDYTRLPAYKALQNLIKTRLHTRSKGSVDKSGRFGFRGYYGKYILTLSTEAGEKLTTQFDLTPDRKEFTVVYDEKNANLKVSDASDRK